MIVEKKVDVSAVTSVLRVASMTSSFLKSSQYKKNGPHGPWLTTPSNNTFVRDELKEKRINTTMGA